MIFCMFFLCFELFVCLWFLVCLFACFGNNVLWIVVFGLVESGGDVKKSGMFMCDVGFLFVC